MNVKLHLTLFLSTALAAAALLFRHATPRRHASAVHDVQAVHNVHVVHHVHSPLASEA